MNDSPKLHEEVLDWIGKEFKEILEDSKQAIYVYVCDRHRLCNKKFSSMLGYASPETWAMKEEMMSDVKEEDQKVIVSAYRNAMEKKIGSSVPISWKNRKNGPYVKTDVILIQLSYKGEMFALHFISVK